MESGQRTHLIRKLNSIGQEPTAATPFDRFIALGSSATLSDMKPNQRIVTLKSSISIIRFDVRPDGEGWTIYDRTTDEPALVEDEQIVGLPRREAEEIADTLNTLALMNARIACMAAAAWGRCSVSYHDREPPSHQHW